MQPYQKASEAYTQQTARPYQAAGTALSLAGSALATSMAGRILPFLSKYIPEDLAQKGLSKLDSRLGTFVQKAKEAGNTFDQVKDFLQDKVGKEAAKDIRNIVMQYDPELDTYIRDKIGKGMSAFQAGEKAKGHPRFKHAIDKLTKDHKASWSAILKSIYGDEAKPQNPSGETLGTMGREEALGQFRNKLMQQNQQQPQQMQAQPQQQGQGAQAMMAILQKINARLGQ